MAMSPILLSIGLRRKLPFLSMGKRDSTRLKSYQALRPDARTELDWKIIGTISEDVPSCSLRQDQVLNLSLVDLSVTTSLLESKSAACRLLKQGGLYLNNNRVDSDAKKIELDDIVHGKASFYLPGRRIK